MSTFLTRAGQRLDDLLATGRMHQDSVLVLLSLLRQHLEATPTAGAKVVKHYANWTLHPVLERGLTPSLLDDVSNVLTADDEKLPDQIIDCLCLPKLRQELIALFAGHRRVEPFHSFSFWKAFVGTLLQSLVDKPLKRSSPAAGSLARHVAALTLTVPDLQNVDPGYVQTFNLKQGSLFWSVQVMPINYELTGPLGFPESASDFLRP